MNDVALIAALVGVGLLVLVALLASGWSKGE